VAPPFCHCRIPSASGFGSRFRARAAAVVVSISRRDLPTDGSPACAGMAPVCSCARRRFGRLSRARQRRAIGPAIVRGPALLADQQPPSAVIPRLR
jgi:hypothetical protein